MLMYVVTVGYNEFAFEELNDAALLLDIAKRGQYVAGYPLRFAQSEPLATRLELKEVLPEEEVEAVPYKDDIPF